MRDGILGVSIWRQRKGISLETIAASTKLSVRLLEAIEAGEFARLPGGIYNTNYIRQYARAIDFDEGDLLAFYRRSCDRVNEGVQSGNRTAPHVTGPLFQN